MAASVRWWSCDYDRRRPMAETVGAASRPANRLLATPYAQHRRVDLGWRREGPARHRSAPVDLERTQPPTGPRRLPRGVAVHDRAGQHEIGRRQGRARSQQPAQDRATNGVRRTGQNPERSAGQEKRRRVGADHGHRFAGETVRRYSARSGWSSTATTRAPAASRCRVSAPRPAPMSRTSWPGRIRACATICAAHSSRSGCQPQTPSLLGLLPSPQARRNRPADTTHHHEDHGHARHGRPARRPAKPNFWSGAGWHRRQSRVCRHVDQKTFRVGELRVGRVDRADLDQ
jgi:hypothetical protein